MSLRKAWWLVRFYRRQGRFASLHMVRWNQWTVLVMLTEEGAKHYFDCLDRGVTPEGAPPIVGVLARLPGVPLLILRAE